MTDASQGEHGLRPITSRSVIIAEPESITTDAGQKSASSEAEPCCTSSSPKQFRTSSSTRLSGKPPVRPCPSLNSLSSLSSLGSVATLEPGKTNESEESSQSKHRRHLDHANSILSQVVEWLHNEKSRRSFHRSKFHGSHPESRRSLEALGDRARPATSSQPRAHHERGDSDSSETSTALDNLGRILATRLKVDSDAHGLFEAERKSSHTGRKKSSRKSSKSIARRLSAAVSSDTEHPDNELLVPAAEVALDNTKTLGYNAGMATSETDLPNLSKRAAKELEAWRKFKLDVVTLTHTLKISGWRRVPLEQSGEIDVERLCGAMTNAVYVVSPPKYLPEEKPVSHDNLGSVNSKSKPLQLLLRVYGPQTGHLIDRESELQILRRLARKKIGPRLLGTFLNGRFEQFFNAKTLTAEDLRVPATSQQIAKRMRELHEGIALLKEERDGGPCTFSKWNKRAVRCDEIAPWLDEQIIFSCKRPGNSQSLDWKARGLVCGVKWQFFRQTVDKYQSWLYKEYGGAKELSKHLAFTHNDTQYGNLLRLEPSGESPLLLPANEHKRLIVIDFEYASANPVGVDFANHFTEWCYNYHVDERSWALDERKYPTLSEQHRFLKAYVRHQPVFQLDSNTPPPTSTGDEEDAAVEAEIGRLQREARLWRAADSAEWVAWGIVQASVPGMDEALEARRKRESVTDAGNAMDASVRVSEEEMPSPRTQPQDNHHHRQEGVAAVAAGPGTADGEDDNNEGEDEEFDTLAYAQERAMFFWGDVLQLGIVKEEELPDELLKKIKTVKV